MKHSLPPCLLLIFIFLSGCASSYKNIRPESIYYPNTINVSDVQYSYTYGALAMRRNKKYVKKEYKKELQVVSVKITNNSSQILVLNENLFLKIGNSPLAMVNPSFTYKQLKQGVWIYLLYLPLNISFTKTETHNGKTFEQSSTVLPTGPVISATNILIASTANNNFKRELFNFDLTGKSIAPGQTIYGLITIQSAASNPIQLEIK